MKKVIVLAAFLFAAVVSINAQQTAPMGNRMGGRGNGHRTEGSADRTPPTAQEMADKEIARETKMLDLTPDQVTKAKAINLKYSQQRADLMAEAQKTKDRASMENKMQGIRLAQDNELKSILTADQQAKLDKAHNGGNHGDGKGKMKGDKGKMGNKPPKDGDAAKPTGN